MSIISRQPSDWRANSPDPRAFSPLMVQIQRGVLATLISALMDAQAALRPGLDTDNFLAAKAAAGSLRDIADTLETYDAAAAAGLAPPRHQLELCILDTIEKLAELAP